MLKIIKNTKRVAKDREIDECPLCGCLFSYTQEDVQKDNEGMVEMIKCPKCGRIITVAKIVPIEPNINEEEIEQFWENVKKGE